MLSSEQIATRKAEIEQARAGFVAQLQTFEENCAKLRTRINQIDGALELVALFEQDTANAKTAEQLADEQAAAEQDQQATSEQPAEQAEVA